MLYIKRATLSEIHNQIGTLQKDGYGSSESFCVHLFSELIAIHYQWCWSEPWWKSHKNWWEEEGANIWINSLPKKHTRGWSTLQHYSLFSYQCHCLYDDYLLTFFLCILDVAWFDKESKRRRDRCYWNICVLECTWSCSRSIWFQWQKRSHQVFEDHSRRRSLCCSSYWSLCLCRMGLWVINPFALITIYYH